ncbi:MAG: hypothetical protein KGO05_06180, partial [Chloroflexota bacterium]|nr:hypothetical protein [Chloroflexota bacterium]
MDQDFARKRQQPGPQERQATHTSDSAAPLDDDGLNPPWDHASGRWPVPAPSTPQPDERSAPLADPHLGTLVERSLPSASMHDFTATGKVTALPPLRPGLSWSRGLKAPRATGAPSSSGTFNRAGVEVDDQPSMHIAALKSSTLLRATTIVSLALLVSRIFGMLRTFLFAYTFKYGSVTDAYTLAFTLPDAIFNIVAGGALASAIIPVFNDYMVKKRDRKTAWYVASAALNTSMILLVIFCLISIIFTEPVLRLAFGDIFRGCPSSPTCSGPLAVELTRIMLLQPIFLGGATVAIALLQARQSFLAPAIGQVIYTLSIVGGIGATLLDTKTG